MVVLLEKDICLVEHAPWQGGPQELAHTSQVSQELDRVCVNSGIRVMDHDMIDLVRKGQQLF